jgi:hypothetical protein
LAQRQADGRRTASLHEFAPEGEDDDQDRQSGEVQNKDHRARSADYRIDALRRAHQEALHAVEIPLPFYGAVAPWCPRRTAEALPYSLKFAQARRLAALAPQRVGGER